MNFEDSFIDRFNDIQSQAKGAYGDGISSIIAFVIALIQSLAGTKSQGQEVELALH